MSTYNGDKSSELRQKVKSLLASQRLCVLSTDSHGQPYGNLIAFAETKDLGSLIFATNRNTRKYNNALSNKRVAVLVDSRNNTASDFGAALAVTAIGEVEEVSGADADVLAQILLSKHPCLLAFVRSPDSALMRVKVKVLIVAGFSETKLMYPDVG